MSPEVKQRPGTVHYVVARRDMLLMKRREVRASSDIAMLGDR